MAYRSDVEAMKSRLADLEHQVGDVTRERDELARLIAEIHARERRQAIFEDLKAGGPTKRLYRNAAITLGAIALSALGVLTYRATRPDKTARLVAQFETYADEMCACKDRACADKVNADMSKWGAEAAKDEDHDKPDEATMKSMTVVAEKLTTCMTKLMMASD